MTVLPLLLTGWLPNTPYHRYERVFRGSVEKRGSSSDIRVGPGIGLPEGVLPRLWNPQIVWLIAWSGPSLHIFVRMSRVLPSDLPRVERYDLVSVSTRSFLGDIFFNQVCLGPASVSIQGLGWIGTVGR